MEQPVELMFLGFPTTDEIAVLGDLRSRNQKIYLGTVGAAVLSKRSADARSLSLSTGSYCQILNAS